MRELPGAGEFLDSLLAGRSRDAIGWVLGCVADGLDVTSVHRDLVMPALVEIGRRWEAGAMTVADEHYCSAALHSLLARMHAFLPRRDPIHRRVIVAGVEGNLHALSLHMLADQFEMDGWEATLVGANTPVADIVAIAARLRADVVAIGATLDDQKGAVLATIRAIRTTPGLDASRIVVGGRATAGWHPTELGCDAILSDLWSAPTRCRALFHAPRESVPVDAGVERPVAATPPTNSIAALAIDNAVHERALSARNIELQHADDAKNKLIGMAAHELRGPLTVLLSGLQFLEDVRPPDPDPDVRQTLIDMHSSVDRMRRLVQDLLDITHASTRNLSLDLGACDLESIVDDAVAATRGPAAAKQIVVNRVRIARVAPVMADAQRLRQVVDNYLSNAIKFSPAGSQIDVDVTIAGGMVRVAVSDAGPGVPARERDRLFRPFSRTSVRPTAGEPSTGLGLAIVARIITTHGGDVGMQSGARGGSEFWFCLPVAENVPGLRPTTRLDARARATAPA